MAKENKKVNNVIVVCSSKGGEGKSLGFELSVV